MRTAFLLAALALLVIVPLAAQPVAAHHGGGWNCVGRSGTLEACTAQYLWWPEDCFMTVDVLGREHMYCYMF